MGAKNIIFLIVAILVAAGLGGLFLVQRGSVNLPTEERPMRDLTFTDYQGQEIALSQFRGKPIIVNAWASWCPFCLDEMPDFAELQEEFGEKIAVIAVNRSESLATAKRFSDQVGVTGRMILLLDPTDSFYKSIGGFSMPETIFVDREGNIAFHKRGPMSLEEMRRRVQEVLTSQNNG